MNAFSCNLLPQEIESLLLFLKDYQKENNSPNIAYFFRYKNFVITLYKSKSDRVLLQGSHVEQLVYELLPGHVKELGPQERDFMSRYSQARQKDGLSNDEKKFVDNDAGFAHKNSTESTNDLCRVIVDKDNNIAQILSLRFIYLVRKFDLGPENIALVTFSNTVADETNALISNEFRNSRFKHCASTFHSFCCKFLVQSFKPLVSSNGKRKNFLVKDKLKIIRNICKQLKLDKTTVSHETISEIIKFKKQKNTTLKDAVLQVCARPEINLDYDKVIDELEKIFDEYTNQTLKVNRFDFEDMVIVTRDLLNREPLIRKKWQKIILIDRFQMMDQGLQEIVSLLVQDPPKLFVVDRTKNFGYLCYGKRPENVQKFIDRFLATKVIDLSRNHDYLDYVNNLSFEIAQLKSPRNQNYSLSNNVFKKQQEGYNSLSRKAQLEQTSKTQNNSFDSTDRINHASGFQKTTKAKLIQIGCDEVGTGDYFGGIVTAAVVLMPGQDGILPKLPTLDSKMLTDREIVNVFKSLDPRVKFDFTTVSPREYNELFDKYQNAHIIKTYLHNRTLAKLIQREGIDLERTNVIMDQFASEQNYNKYLSIINPLQKITVNVFETKAEAKYPTVGLASIIARYFFLEQIKQLSINANQVILLGASDPKIRIIARNIYNKLGDEGLRRFVKFHFRTTDEVKGLSE